MSPFGPEVLHGHFVPAGVVHESCGRLAPPCFSSRRSVRSDRPATRCTSSKSRYPSKFSKRGTQRVSLEYFRRAFRASSLGASSPMTAHGRCIVMGSPSSSAAADSRSRSQAHLLAVCCRQRDLQERRYEPRGTANRNPSQTASDTRSCPVTAKVSAFSRSQTRRRKRSYSFMTVCSFPERIDLMDLHGDNGVQVDLDGCP